MAGVNGDRDKAFRDSLIVQIQDYLEERLKEQQEVISRLESDRDSYWMAKRVLEEQVKELKDQVKEQQERSEKLAKKELDTARKWEQERISNHHRLAGLEDERNQAIAKYSELSKQLEELKKMNSTLDDLQKKNKELEAEVGSPTIPFQHRTRKGTLGNNAPSTPPRTRQRRKLASLFSSDTQTSRFKTLR